MIPTLLNPSHASHALRPLAVLVAASLALALSACNKQDEGKTAGQQLDSAIAKTEDAAARAKAKAESEMASAGAAVKNATQSAESSGKDMAAKAGEKIDDLTITTTVTAGFAKDPDLSVLKINVDTRDGAVILKGSAPTTAARDKAAELAKAVKGVKSVDNKLEVKAAG
ncbi:putative periplasmic or secreted lipoprotein [Polaromonas sp. CF318]|uniref:BON domain-containing protein n=1 Tax=Polaromonas sp. CF318 TaxID=1144318 RepID=UPI0002711F14|nr:BON domain-containing protein [Polaromonas sp. CF318]EJL84428.1 putative periplasmic or secreted lipoprotein [Polaromonas sp. CF318]